MRWWLMSYAWPTAAILSLVLVSCGSDDSKKSCPFGAKCSAAQPSGPPRGLRADGTVDITPEEAWPKRAAESPPLSAEELARACVALAACETVEPEGGASVEETRKLLLNVCTRPSASYFWEERAVMTGGQRERWTFEAREVISLAGDCAAIREVPENRPKEIVCEEVGCWWQSPTHPIPSVTCEGTVATLRSKSDSTRTIVRDCARALAICDPSSSTGCTDRAPVACTAPASDRCDGDIRIGCDGTGRVSFHDCGRVPGGTCGDTGDGLGCIYPDTLDDCPPGTYGCEGDVLHLCVLGTAVDIDCRAAGFAACANDYCVAP